MIEEMSAIVDMVSLTRELGIGFEGQDAGRARPPAPYRSFMSG
jgi:hypothetical protein